jgi:hypothetical protein
MLQKIEEQLSYIKFNRAKQIELSAKKKDFEKEQSHYKNLAEKDEFNKINN